MGPLRHRRQRPDAYPGDEARCDTWRWWLPTNPKIGAACTAALLDGGADPRACGAQPNQREITAASAIGPPIRYIRTQMAFFGALA